MSKEEIKIMILAANGANHVGEYPKGEYCPMQNRVGEIHSVSNLKKLLRVIEQRDHLVDALQELHDAISAGRYEDPSHDRIYQALIDSRAAIAAAKGGDL